MSDELEVLPQELTAFLEEISRDPPIEELHQDSQYYKDIRFHLRRHVEFVKEKNHVIDKYKECIAILTIFVVMSIFVLFPKLLSYIINFSLNWKVWVVCSTLLLIIFIFIVIISDCIYYRRRIIKWITEKISIFSKFIFRWWRCWQESVTAHGVGLTAAKDLKNSLFSGSFGDIYGRFNLMARKIGTCGDLKANPVSSYQESDAAISKSNHPQSKGTCLGSKDVNLAPHSLMASLSQQLKERFSSRHFECYMHVIMLFALIFTLVFYLFSCFVVLVYDLVENHGPNDLRYYCLYPAVYLWNLSLWILGSANGDTVKFVALCTFLHFILFYILLFIYSIARKFVVYMMDAKASELYPRAIISTRVLDLLLFVEAGNSLWEDTEYKGLLIKKVERIAYMFDPYLRKKIKAGDKETDEWVHERFINIADNFRDQKKSICISDQYSRHNFCCFIARAFVYITLGWWERLESYEHTHVSASILSKVGLALKVVAAACIPFMICLIIQNFVGIPLEFSIWIITASVPVFVIVYLLSPEVFETVYKIVGAVPSISGLFFGHRPSSRANGRQN